VSLGSSSQFTSFPRHRHSEGINPETIRYSGYVSPTPRWPGPSIVKDVDRGIPSRISLCVSALSSDVEGSGAVLDPGRQVMESLCPM